MKPFFVRQVAVVFLSFQILGCGPRVAPPLVSTPSEDQRTHMGRVGVVSVIFPPETELGVPVIGRDIGAVRGTAGGAASGAGAGVNAFLSCGPQLALCALFVVMVPVLAVTGAILGGTAGAASALPEERAKAIEKSVAEAMTESRPQRTLRQYVRQAAEVHRIRGIEDVLDAGESEQATSDYKTLHQRGIDTILEVGVLRVGLYGGTGANPLLGLFIESRVRLLTAKNGNEIYSRSIIHAGPVKRLLAWGDNDAAILKKELNLIYRKAADYMVETVFLIHE